MIETLHDVVVDEALVAKTRRRFDHFVPNYLRQFLRTSDRIVSIGCGLGYDVRLLCSLGYDAYGLDPGSRTSAWKTYPDSLRRRLRMGFAEDLPFGHECCDFAYALEVIEHVGCEDGIWKLLPDAREVRHRFIESCLAMLKPGGRLLLSTSNRLCPVDVGHAHHYTRFTDASARTVGINLAIPWHQANFVWSFGDVARYVSETSFGSKCRVEAVTSVGYPSQSSNGNRSRALVRSLSGAFLRAVNLEPIRTSFLNPILVAMITRS